MLPMRIIYIVLARASSRVRLPSKRPGFISWLQYARSGGIHIFDIFASVNTARRRRRRPTRPRLRPAGSATTIYILSENTMYCIYLYIKRMRRIRLRCRGRTAAALSFLSVLGRFAYHSPSPPPMFLSAAGKWAKTLI